jgi:hypothetical protein
MQNLVPARQLAVDLPRVLPRVDSLKAKFAQEKEAVVLCRRRGTLGLIEAWYRNDIIGFLAKNLSRKRQ